MNKQSLYPMCPFCGADIAYVVPARGCQHCQRCGGDFDNFGDAVDPNNPEDFEMTDMPCPSCGTNRRVVYADDNSPHVLYCRGCNIEFTPMNDDDTELRP